MLLNARWRFGDILLLSSNNRISSFYWIRGSKDCFLTSVSNFNRYFLFLVFLRNRNLLVFAPFLAARESNFSSRFFIHLVLWVPRRTCAPIFLAHLTRFFEARRSWEPGRRISSTGFPFRLLPKVSHVNVHWAGNRKSHLFFLRKIPWTDIFLSDISLR